MSSTDDTLRRQYRVLTEEEQVAMQLLKDKGTELLMLIDSLPPLQGGGTREKSLAKTKVEEAVMWAVKHITA